MDSLNIEKQYEIIKAEPTEWARYHAIYRLTQFNEWMSLSFERDIDRYKKVDFCYWVIKDNVKVGGALIKPNMLKCVFIIPPFNNEVDMIKNLVEYVQSISCKDSEIIIPDVTLNSYKYYEKCGFKYDRSEKLLVCPTNNYEITWGEEYRAEIPKEEHIKEMAQLYYETYRKSNVPYIAAQNYDFQVNSVEIYFKHRIMTNAPAYWSTLIYDDKNNRLIGACTVGVVNDLPYILDFVVHSEFQRRGIASKMMKRVLALTHNKYPAVRLSVTVGNSAEIFYKKIGFIGLGERMVFIKENRF